VGGSDQQRRDPSVTIHLPDKRAGGGPIDATIPRRTSYMENQYD
jgi:hypothetical protein